MSQSFILSMQKEILNSHLIPMLEMKRRRRKSDNALVVAMVITDSDLIEVDAGRCIMVYTLGSRPLILHSMSTRH